MFKSLESIFTRAISILSKFLLLTFLAKTLSLSDYGYYQLVAYFTIIAISIYGLEYYMHGNREVASSEETSKKINAHLSFFFTTLPVTLITQIILIWFLVPHEILSLQVILILLFSNFCDYFNQEIYRYLIFFQKIRKANIMLIAKSSIFLALLFIYYFFKKKLNLSETLFIMFVSYAILLCITSMYFFKNIISYKDIKISFLSIEEFKKNILLLFPFITMMFFVKGLDFFDKFAIEYYYGAEAVGIYSFLFSIGYLIYVFVVSGFYLIYLPECIIMNEKKDILIKQKLIKFSLLVLSSSFIMSIGVIAFIDVLLNIVGKSDLIENVYILYLLLVAFFFLNVSLVPSIILYIRRKDKTVMIINGIVFCVNAILNIVLLNSFGIEGAALALVFTYIINLLILSYKANTEWGKMKKAFLLS